ncbi:MAG: trypsin-like peptidase domain-containing protein [Candidatus Pacebacteria bacterium]|nr:trypsin-like peptidase domain-containing protein [Candidatus Paceibacterota bacterium]
MHQRLIITCTLLLVVAVGAGYAGWRSGLNTITNLEQARLAREEALIARTESLESTLLLVANETTNLRAGITAEVEKSSAEKEKLNDAIAKLSSVVSEQEGQITTLEKSADVAGIIETWDPYVYDITCSFEGGDDPSESSGSAVLQQTASGVRFLTSRHIVITEGETLKTCELTRPNTSIDYDIEASNITLSEDHDVAYGILTETPLAMRASDTCATKPQIGDKVVMLGYPTIGAEETVTATEGIISGFDEDYYTTSAKIERGNSGGAAIDVKGSCFLGLPTMVFAGRIESLARILPASSI